MRLFFFALLTALLPLSAHAYDSKARALYVVDFQTGTVLLEKNAQTPLPPASMSKLMTLFMMFEALKEGRLGLTQSFPVSTKAWQMGGSKMFLKEGDNVSIENLLRGIIVQSGNDACIVVAEGLAGSEAEFANRMTRRARQMGMENSVFANSTGWPDPDHRMSAQDLVSLASAIIRDFPEYYAYFSERSFTWEGIVQENRNPLLAMDMGADGLKTGHTEEAGYGLVGSAEQDGRRIVFMISGLASAAERAQESQRLVSWAFREFSQEVMFAKDEVITAADVWLGAVPTVDLVPGEEVEIIIPYTSRDELKAEVRYQSPIEAPIEKGDQLANLVISVPGVSDVSIPLFAGGSVGTGGFAGRFMASAQILGRKVLDAAASSAQ